MVISALDLTFALEKEKAEFVFSNMFGKDYQSLAEEFKLSIALRPNVSQIVYHVWLSVDPKEKLNDRLGDNLARKYLKSLGFESSQFVAVKHSDPSHQHRHLVTSLVDLNENIVKTGNDYYRSQLYYLLLALLHFAAEGRVPSAQENVLKIYVTENNNRLVDRDFDPAQKNMLSKKKVFDNRI